MYMFVSVLTIAKERTSMLKHVSIVGLPANSDIDLTVNFVNILVKCNNVL